LVNALEAEFYDHWKTPLNLKGAQEKDAASFLQKWPSRLEVFMEGDQNFVKLVDKVDSQASPALPADNRVCTSLVPTRKAPPSTRPSRNLSAEFQLGKEESGQHVKKTKEKEVEPDSDESGWGRWSGKKPSADNRVCTTPVVERALPPNKRRRPAPLSPTAVVPLPHGVRPPKCHQRIWRPCPLAIKLFGTPRGRPMCPRGVLNDKGSSKTRVAPAGQRISGPKPLEQAAAVASEHRFAYSPGLAAQLEQQRATRWTRDYGLYNKLVRENDLLMK
jgi:hypothetical protein